MTQAWKKLGQVLGPVQSKPWNQKYCILPVPVFMASRNLIRVFYGTTDLNNYGRILHVDLDPSDPRKIVNMSDEILLDLGQPGTFDDCGVVPSCCIKLDDRYFLYTVGFQRTHRTPYMLFAGLASSNDLLNFSRVTEAPILPRTSRRYISQGAPCVLFESGKFRMWHWYATKWIKVKDKDFMDYHIGYAESYDGVTWNMSDRCCIAPDPLKGEFAVARPWVERTKSGFEMFYSVRSIENMYRIKRATSDDGLTWRIDNNIPIEPSPDGWDSEMICYPSIVSTPFGRYMFYNGNNNGETGFGVARWVECNE